MKWSFSPNLSLTMPNNRKGNICTFPAHQDVSTFSGLLKLKIPGSSLICSQPALSRSHRFSWIYETPLEVQWSKPGGTAERIFAFRTVSATPRATTSSMPALRKRSFEPKTNQSHGRAPWGLKAVASPTMCLFHSPWRKEQDESPWWLTVSTLGQRFPDFPAGTLIYRPIACICVF